MRFFQFTDWVRKAAAAAIFIAGTTSAFAWVVGPDSGKVEFSSASYSQPEGTSSDITLNVQVRRVEGSLGQCQARVSLGTNRTATLDSDFAFTSGYVTWASGDSSIKNFPVTIKHDWIDEPGETFELFLTEPLGTTIGTISTTVVTIADNDGCKDKNNLPCPCGTAGCFDPNGAVQFTANTYTGAEDSGSANGSIQVNLARVNGSDGPISVNLVTVTGGSATAGVDYQSASAAVSWADGDSAVKTVNLTTYLDSLDEQDETVFIALQNPSGGAVLGSPANAVALLQDNDNPPAISLSSPNPSSAYEGNSGTRVLYFAASLSAYSGKSISAGINFSGTATSLDDYRIDTPLPLTFAPGELSKSVAVTVYGDTTYEPDETIALQLGTLTNVIAGSSSSAGYNLINDDLNPDGGCKDKNNLPCPCGTPGCTSYGAGQLSLSATSYSQLEEVDGNGQVRIDVNRTGGSTGSVAAEVAIAAGGTATPGTDYFVSTQYFSWADGDTSTKSQYFEFMSDNIDEPDETFSIYLRNPTGGAQIIEPTTATVTILDNDDPPTVSISGPSPGAVLEGSSSNGAPVEFTVSLSAASLVPVNVYFSTGGTASPGEDYGISHDQAVSFQPGETNQVIEVLINPDTNFEPDENITIELGNAPENASLGSPSSASVVILNDDDEPSVDISNFSSSTVNEGQSLNYSLNVSGSSSQAITVQLSATGTASSGADYMALQSPVSIPAGQTSLQGTLQTIDDALNELSETVRISISGVQGGRAGVDQTQVATIIDNDTQQPQVTISGPASQTIPEAGGATAFTVSLSEESGREVTVNFTTNGTAETGSDFILEPASSVVFAPGETQKTISVEAIDDFIDEADEDFVIELQSAEGADIGSSGLSGSCVIVDDEDPLVAFVSPLDFVEGTTATIAAELTTTASEVTTVVVATRDLGKGYSFATGGQDYQATTATLVFQPGQVRTEMQVLIFDDQDYEQDEQFEVRFISAINASPTSPVSITIINDDPAPSFQLEQSPTVSETAGQVGVRIKPVGTEPTVPVPIAVSFSGTAINGTDYLALSQGQLTYLPGAPRPELKFQIISDSVSETPESIDVALNGQNAGTITITDVDGIKYFEIHPKDDVIVGPQRQIRFTAIGRNGLGQEVPSNPVWGRVGPGTISPAGLYISPLSATADRVTIQVAEQGHPEITGSREIRLDLQPPRVSALSIRDLDSESTLLPGEAVSGEAMFYWRLDAQPEEISGPVEYTLILDDRQEVARLTSDGATTSALEFSAPWQSTSVADGVHTIKIRATDSVGNSNADQMPELIFRVQNGSTLPGDYAGTDAGIDWLLENQWRKSDQAFGSWENHTTRTITEKIIETAFAAEALSACDLRYVSSRPNLYSGTTVTVAQAYHDAISWLCKRWAAGEITDFVDQAVVHQVLSGTQAKRSRIMYHLGAVSPDFDKASALSSSFATADNFASEQLSDGSYGATEESRGSRYETLMALRSAIKSRDRNLLSSMLAGSGGIATIPAYLEENRLSKGWSNTTRLGDTSSNFYLTAEMTAAILAVTKTANSLDLQQMLFPAIMDLKTSMSAPAGDVPHLYSTPVDVSAALHALALGKLSSAAALIDASVTSGAASFLYDTQSKANGSWNSRALDTAWALRALRPELSIVPDSLVHDPLTQKLTVFVRNMGAVATTETRVSAYSVNPAGLAPHERSRYLLGSARVPGVLYVDGILPVSIQIKQQDTPIRAYIMVDPEERIAEYDETNNNAVWSLPELPNLVVYARDIKASSVNGGVPVAGTTWTITATIRNMGLTPIPVSNNVPIRLYAGNPLLDANANYLMFQTLHSSEGIGTHLDAGESAEVTFEVLPERLDLQTAAIHRLYVWADPFSGRGVERGSIHESNEFDNIASKDVRVYEPGSHQFADLRILPEAIEPQPPHVMAGNTGKIRVRVDNVGAGPADPFNLGVSIDEFGTSTPIRMGKIAAGQSAVVFVPFVPDSSTSYTVIALADTEGEIRENDKTNNLAMATLVAGLGPDGDIDLGIATPDVDVSRSGANVIATATVHNVGRDILASENPHFVGTLQITRQDGSAIGEVYVDESRDFDFDHGQIRESEKPINEIPDPPIVAVSYDLAITKGVEELDADTRPENNGTSRTFNLSHTNLRAINLNASPSAAIITDISKGTTPVALTVTVANGDGSELMDEASPVHLEIRDKATSRVLGYWNNLTLPGVKTTTAGLANILSYSLPPVNLPPGFHVLQAEIDPVGYFVETNEADNIIEIAVEIKDTVTGRLPADLEITASDVELRQVDGYVVADVTVRNVAPESAEVAAKQSPPTLLKLFSSSNADSATTVPLPVAPIFVPSLISGEEYRISVPTQLSTPSDGYLWLEVDSDGVVAERSEDNNRVARKLEAHESSGLVAASAVFNTITVNWTPPVEVPDKYRVARYKVEAGPGAALQRVWSFEGSVTDLLDEDPAIEANTTYYYLVWAKSDGGLWSMATQSNIVETGAVPYITSAVIDSQPFDINPELGYSTTVSLSSKVDIQVSYSGNGVVELYRNFEKVGQAVCVNGTADFNNVNLLFSANEFRSIARSLGTQAVSDYSNPLVIYYQLELPDISYKKKSDFDLDFDVTLWADSGQTTNPITDFSKTSVYRALPIGISFGIINNMSPDMSSSLPPFYVGARINLKDHDPVTIIKPVVLNEAGAVVLPISETILFNALPEDAIIQSVEIRLDCAPQLIDFEKPGEVLEANESNNLLILKNGEIKDTSNVGNDFWITHPYNIEGPPDFALVLYDAESDGQEVEFSTIIDDGSTTSYLHSLHDASVELSKADSLFWDYTPAINTTSPLLLYSADYYGSAQEHIYKGCSLRLRSDSDFAVNLIKYDEHQDYSSIIPATALGSKYVIPLINVVMPYDYPSFFQILATEDTTVKITQNFLGFPKFSQMGGSSTPPAGTISPDGITYLISLEAGDTYIWRSYGDQYEDVTGVQVESLNGSKLAVFAGADTILPVAGSQKSSWEDMFVMVPPVDMLGQSYIMHPLPLTGTTERPSGFADIFGNEAPGIFQNNFSRIIAVMDDTVVTLKDDSQTTYTTLSAGQFMEIGEYSLGTYEGSYPDPLLDPSKVHRIIDSKATTRVITSSNPVMIATYLLSPGEYYRSSEGGVALPLVGGPDMFINQPLESFNNNNLVPFSLFDFDKNGKYNDTGFPRQIVSIMAKKSVIGIPNLYLGSGSDYLTSLSIGRSSEMERLWEPITIGNEDSNYVKIDINLVEWRSKLTRGADQFQYYLANPDKADIAIKQFGFGRGEIDSRYTSSYGMLSGLWNSRAQQEVEEYPIDLEVTAGSIYFPYGSRIRDKIPVIARVEVVNNGTTDISSTHDAVLTVWKRVAGESGTTEILFSKSIPKVGELIKAKRQLPATVDFSFVPDRNIIAIGASVTVLDDGDSTNNTAERSINVDFVDLPEFAAQAIDAVTTSGLPSAVVTATVKNINTHVNQVPVRWTINTGQSIRETVARFTPDAVVATQPNYQAETTATLFLNDLPLGTDITVTAHFNPDYTITEATPDGPENDEENSTTTVFKINSVPFPNLAISAQSIPGSQQIGSAVDLDLTITNDNQAELRNVPVVVNLGSMTGPEVGRALIPILDRASSKVLSIPVTVSQEGPNAYYATVNPSHVPEEASYGDNTAIVQVNGVESNLPDLTVTAENQNFIAPLEVVRGEALSIESLIKNVGLSDVVTSYKVQIFDGGDNARNGFPVLESILNAPDGTVQSPDAGRGLTGSWDTTSASLGRHDLHMVIDSPDHLAAASLSAQETEPSRAPMTAMYMADKGVRVGDLPQALSGRHWSLKIYAASGIPPLPGDLIGVYDSRSGYRNTTGTIETTGTGALLKVAGPAPVQLIVSAEDGLPLPHFDGELPMAMTFVDHQGTTETARYTTLNVVLPGNETGQYGTGCSFWLADDGSTYHTSRMHLGRWYGEVGTETLSAFDAMNDQTGTVAEANEINNRFTRAITIIQPALPNIKMLELEADTSAPLTGKAVTFTAGVTNSGADLTTASRLRFEAAPVATGNAFEVIAPDQLILQPIYYGQILQRSFTWLPEAAGEYVVRVTADPDDEIFELNPDDNAATMTVSVSGSTSLSLVIPEDGPFASENDVPVVATVSSDEQASGILTVDVVPSGFETRVGTADVSTSMPFKLRGIHSFDTLWETGPAPTGSYRFRGMLNRLENGRVASGSIKAYSESFDLEEEARIAVGIQTDRYSYRPGDTVYLRLLTQNLAVAQSQDQVELQCRIVGSEGEEVYQNLKTFINVAPGEIRIWNDEWQTSGTSEGDYQAFVSAFNPGSGIPLEVAYTTFRIDGTGPTLVMDEPTSGSWNRWSTRVVWSAAPGVTDIATSEGLALAIPYVLDEQSTVTMGDLASGDVVTTEGLILVDAWARDFGGNSGPMSSVEFYVDKTSPTLTQTNAEVTKDGSDLVLVTGYGHDYDGSGIADIIYRRSIDSDWTTATNVLDDPTTELQTQSRFEFDVPVDGGQFDILIKAIDRAGNGSDVTSVTIEGDLQAPQITVSSTCGTTVSGQFTISAAVTDDLTGIDSGTVEYSIIQNGIAGQWSSMFYASGTSFTATYTALVDSWGYMDAPATVLVRARDLANNGENSSSQDLNPGGCQFYINNGIPPQAPTGLRASFRSYEEVEIEWNSASEPDMSHYQIYRGTGITGSMESLAPISGLVADDRTSTTNRFIHEDQQLIAIPDYYRFGMKAYDQAANESLWSKIITVPQPDTPANLVAIGGNQKVTLRWEPVREGFVKGYRVYKAAAGTSFTLHSTLEGRLTTQTIDLAVINGQEYSYYVVALDGANNESRRSAIVTAVPGVRPTTLQGVKVRFEDGAGSGGIDWDFNDVGANVDVELQLNSNDYVTTIIYTAVLERHDGSSSYDMFAGIVGLKGTGTYSGVVYTQNGSIARQVQNHAYAWNSSDELTRYFPLFERIGGTSNADKQGYKAVITVALNNPEMNPVIGFAKAPYDLWMRVLDSNPVIPEYHIYDPQIAELSSADFLIRVQENDPYLGGQPVGFGIVIPSKTWTQPYNGKALWLVYPDFVDFVKTWRSADPQNLNWYDNGPYNPN